MSPLTEQEIIVGLSLIPLIAAGYYICKILFKEDSADTRARFEKECDRLESLKTKDLQQ